MYSSRHSVRDIHGTSCKQVSSGRGIVLKVDTPPYAVLHSASHHAREKKVILNRGSVLRVGVLTRGMTSCVVFFFVAFFFFGFTGG